MCTSAVSTPPLDAMHSHWEIDETINNKYNFQYKQVLIIVDTTANVKVKH